MRQSFISAFFPSGRPEEASEDSGADGIEIVPQVETKSAWTRVKSITKMENTNIEIYDFDKDAQADTWITVAKAHI